MGLTDAVKRIRDREAADAEARKAELEKEATAADSSEEPTNDTPPPTEDATPSSGGKSVVVIDEGSDDADDGDVEAALEEEGPVPSPVEVAEGDIMLIAEREGESIGKRVKFVGHESGATVLVYLPPDEAADRAEVTVLLTD